MTYAGNLKYAVYPGSVTLRDGTVKVWTAGALAVAYGLPSQKYSWAGTAHNSISNFVDDANAANNRSNLIPNPSFEVNTSSWTAYNSAVLTRVNNEYYNGAYSLKISTTGIGASAWQGTNSAIITVTNGAAYIYSYWVKGTAGDSVKVYKSNVGGTDSSTTYTLTGAWQRVSHSFTADSGSLILYIIVENANVAVRTVYVDALTLELGSTLKDYFDGDTPDNAPYLVVNSNLDLPRDPLGQLGYIHLVPRADDVYESIKYTAEDDGANISYRPDFDGNKKYTTETDRRNFDREFIGD